LIRHCLKDLALIGAIMCGILVTWTTAAIGYQMFRPGICHGRSWSLARGRIKEIATGIAIYQLDNGRSSCPSGDDLTREKYVARGGLKDPWGTFIAFHCMPGGDIVVRSAGPDRLFHTNDDIMNGAR
jgi:hypothetical protein